MEAMKMASKLEGVEVGLGLRIADMVLLKRRTSRAW